jgi:hypothetical protein
MGASGSIDGIIPGISASSISDAIMRPEHRQVDMHAARQAQYTQKLSSWRPINIYLLGFTNATYAVGADFAGTINGEPADGVGQILTRSDDSVTTAGLKAKITMANATRHARELDDIVPLIAGIRDAWAGIRENEQVARHQLGKKPETIPAVFVEV